MGRSKVLGSLAVGALALSITTVGLGSTAGAAATATVYIDHALDATGDGPGSSAVTVCVDGAVVDADFTYSEQIGPVSLSLDPHQVTVILGADEVCTSEPQLIDVSLTPPGVGTYVITAWNRQLPQLPSGSPDGPSAVLPEGPQLAVAQIDDSCVPAGTARLGAGHFASAGPVKVLVDGTTSTIDDLSMGQLQTNGQTAASHTVNVELVADSSEVFDFGSVPLTNPVLTIGFVTGGYPELVFPGEFANTVPIRGFANTITLTSCEQPTTTTTTSTTTSTSTTTTTTKAVVPVAVAAKPAFAG